MNEAETRAEHIDPALKAAGWGVMQNHFADVGKMVGISSGDAEIWLCAARGLIP